MTEPTGYRAFTAELALTKLTMVECIARTLRRWPDLDRAKVKERLQECRLGRP